MSGIISEDNGREPHFGGMHFSGYTSLLLDV